MMTGYPAWSIPLFLWAVSIYSSLLYSLRHFVIVSDSAFEYSTYIKYISQGYWTPISDNILSSSLFTTWIPAAIQRFLNIPNQEVVYRVWLAIICSFLPVTVYLLVRKYTSVGVSVGLAMVIYTSFYYQGFASYARMLIAVTMFCCLILCVLWSSRWKFLFIAMTVAGILVGHYSAAYVYQGVLVVTSLVIIVKYVVLRKKTENGIAIILSAMLLSLGAYYYYGDGLVRAVGDYAFGVRTHAIDEVTEIAKDLTSAHEIIQNTKIAWSVPADIYFARMLLFIRGLIAIVIWCVLLRMRKAWSVNGILYLAVIGVAFSALSLKSVEAYLGSLRPSFIVLPLELLGVAYWWGKGRADWRLYPLLAIGIVVYH